jgi:UDP-N-acetylmuramate dehydrogenase
MYASKMIDECGLKGYSCGGAQVSTKHAGFIVNTGGATADDVLRLIGHIQETVNKRFGIWLEPEIERLS